MARPATISAASPALAPSQPSDYRYQRHLIDDTRPVRGSTVAGLSRRVPAARDHAAYWTASNPFNPLARPSLWVARRAAPRNLLAPGVVFPGEPVPPAPPTAPGAPAPAASRRQVFRVRGLTKIYGEGTAQVRALDGVDLDLHEGELVVLLGPSGSGKTTLLNQLGGLDLPTAGELAYRGTDLTHATEQQLTSYRRNSVGFIFQFYNLIPSLTARENVGLITEIARDPMPPEEALALVSLTPRLDHFPAQLSGGEQQRVAIARAIAKRPEVLLCDEPTGALDVRTGIVVLEALERANRELGTLTILITHNAVMAEMADRVIHFSDGRVLREHRNATRAAPSTLRW
ncbi:MAG: ABC transporter ATP-binding protein [Opitutae bacterium]|nr:ABC transporter ATP-binding protein [Opitutae bacterium]